MIRISILQTLVTSILLRCHFVTCFNGAVTSKLQRVNVFSSTSCLDAKFKFRLDDGDDDDGDGGDKGKIDSVFGIPRRTFGAEAVPEDQRPANEYLDLISAPFFDWADEETGTKGFMVRLTGLYTFCFALVCWPISGATFTEDGFFLHKFCASNVGAFGFILIFLIRLYTGWGYIGSRLRSKTIEYEESGWYDGAIEPKTEAEIARDLLLYRANVLPVQDRLKTFLFTAGALWVAACVSLNLVYSAKPIFNEYDATLLNRLRQDEGVANVAAKQSNGRPTYCDSRYYRAIANGGQGCN